MIKNPEKVGVDDALLVREYMSEHHVSAKKACEALNIKLGRYYKYARAAGIEVGPRFGGRQAKKAHTTAPSPKNPNAPKPVVAARVGQKPGQIMLVVGNPADIASIIGKIL